MHKVNMMISDTRYPPMFLIVSKEAVMSPPTEIKNSMPHFRSFFSPIIPTKRMHASKATKIDIIKEFFFISGENINGISDKNKIKFNIIKIFLNTAC